MRSVTWASLSAIAQNLPCLGQLSISGPRRTSTLPRQGTAWRVTQATGTGSWKPGGRPSAQPLWSIDRRHDRLSAGFSACASTFGHRSSCRREHHVPASPTRPGSGDNRIGFRAPSGRVLSGVWRRDGLLATLVFGDPAAGLCEDASASSASVPLSFACSILRWSSSRRPSGSGPAHWRP